MNRFLVLLIILVAGGNQFVVAMKETVYCWFDGIEEPIAFELTQDNVVDAVSKENGIVRRIPYTEFIGKLDLQGIDPNCLSQTNFVVKTTEEDKSGIFIVSPKLPMKNWIHYSKYLGLSTNPVTGPSATCTYAVGLGSNVGDVVELGNNLGKHAVEIVFSNFKSISDIKNTVLTVNSQNHKVAGAPSEEDNLLYVRFSQHTTVHTLV